MRIRSDYRAPFVLLKLVQHVLQAGEKGGLWRRCRIRRFATGCAVAWTERATTPPILVTAEDPSANVIMINARDYGNMLENLYVLSDSEPRKNLTRACGSSSGAGFGCASWIGPTAIKAWFDGARNDCLLVTKRATAGEAR